MISDNVHCTKHPFFLLLLLVVHPFTNLHPSRACTNVLVTPGASKDGHSMISYNADSPSLMGMLYHYPPTSRSDPSSGWNATREVYDWDHGTHLGSIPQAESTYNVIGNTNSQGLVIAESTFGGLAILSHQTDAILDYGSLIYITLQRCRTSREAIHTMNDLMDRYGYASTGESFSLTDSITGEVWLMEVIGRGDHSEKKKKKGAVWVARRIPDGYVSAHANQARITTFPRDDPDNAMYSDDVIDFAVEMKLYERGKDGDDADFSFSDVYDPLTFSGARFCEARVWSVFGSIVDGFLEEYGGYARGMDLEHRMPLWVQPRSQLSLEDLMSLMNSHYEGTVLDFGGDVGAGESGAPYRTRPLTWTIAESDANDKKYLNERSIATQQTGWNFVAQVRGAPIPHELSSILWFAVDDSSTSPRFPVYGSSRNVSAAFGGLGVQDGVKSPLLDFDLTKAFWVQNMVSNFAYPRWNQVYPVVRKKIDELHQNFLVDVKEMDEIAMEAYHERGMERAVELVTSFSVRSGDYVHREWMKFYGELFVRFRDLYDIGQDKKNQGCGCNIVQPGMSEDWKKRIVKDTGMHYVMPDGKVFNPGEDYEVTAHGGVVISKHRYI